MRGVFHRLSLTRFFKAEDFWSHYVYMAKPSDLPLTGDLYMFVEPAKPMWEDPANQNGGRFILRAKFARCASRAPSCIVHQCCECCCHALHAFSRR